MKTHRVCQCPSTDGNPQPHTFVETEPDSWLEIKTDEVEKLTHQAIHNHLDKEQKEQTFDMRMSARYFRIHSTPLTELTPITE